MFLAHLENSLWITLPQIKADIDKLVKQKQCQIYHWTNKKFWEELILLLSLHTSFHAMVAIVTSPKDCMWSKQNNPTIKQSQTIAVQGWKACLQLTALHLNHFKMIEVQN
jgi:hypothetical protein